MNKQAPSAARILTMIAFAASCIGLLLFLWISFGGTTSLGPKGYEISAEFNQAENLGSQADVRISGVNVGKVVGVSLDRHTGLTRAVMEIDPQFAPRPVDTHAILRQKTLLGETYIELSPGTPSGRKLRDGASLPKGQIAPTVQLDQILSTFDPTTRQAFETWMQQQGHRADRARAGPERRAGRAISVRDQRRLGARCAEPRQRRHEHAAARRRTGVFVDRTLPSALQQLVDNSNAAFSATARQANALAAHDQGVPGLPGRAATDHRPRQGLLGDHEAARRRVATRGRAAQPGLEIARRPCPAAEEPARERGAADARVAGRHSRARAVPRRQRAAARPRPTPYLGGVIPVVDYINTYRREVAGFFANSTAAAEATAPAAVGHKLLHYVRVSSPLNPETLTDYANRLSTQSRQPVSGPGRLLESRLRSPRVRQLSVHEQSSADDRPYYCARAGCGAERRSTTRPTRAGRRARRSRR